MIGFCFDLLFVPFLMQLLAYIVETSILYCGDWFILIVDNYALLQLVEICSVIYDSPNLCISDGLLHLYSSNFRSFSSYINLAVSCFLKFYSSCSLMEAVKVCTSHSYALDFMIWS